MENAPLMNVLSPLASAYPGLDELLPVQRGRETQTDGYPWLAARCPKVMDVCRQVMPAPVNVDQDHWMRCHLFAPGASVRVS